MESRSTDKKISVDCRNDLFSKHAVRELLGHYKKVQALAWNRDGLKLASGGTDRSIRVWSIEPHSSVLKPERADCDFKEPQDMVACLSWQPTHTSVFCAAAYKDHYVRFFDVREKKHTNAVSMAASSGSSSGGSGSTCAVYTTYYSPDGMQVLVTCGRNEVAFIDTRKMKKQRQWTYKAPVDVMEAAFGPTPDMVTMALSDGSLRISPLHKLELTERRMQAHMGSTACFAYSANCKWLASGGQDGVATLWDTDDMICTKTFIRPDQPVKAVSFSGDGQWLGYTSEDGLVDVVSSHPGELACSLQLRTYSDCLAWSPSHQVLAFTDEVLMPRDTLQPCICLWAPPR